jgi:RND family efflux transporter MFP subunit
VKKLLFSLIAVGLMLVGAAYWINASHSAVSEVPFTTADIEWGSLTDVVSATGQLAPRSVALVSSPVGGQVVMIYRNADFNHFVQEGEPLLELDQSQARIKVQEAEGAVAAAQADVQRAEAARTGADEALKYRKSLPEGVGTKAQALEATYALKGAEAACNAARLKVKALQAQRAEAQLGLEKTVVRAPASGVIVDRKVMLGQMVGPQLPTPLFTLASDLSRMQVLAQVAEGDLSKVRDGLPASFTVYAYADTNDRFEGKVKEVRYLPNSVQGAVFYTTVITVANRRMPAAGPDWKQAGDVVAAARHGPLNVLPWLQPRPDAPWMLRPGMTATVDVLVRRHEKVWKVPTAALNFQLDEHYQTEAAKAKLERWQARSDRDEWKVIWVLGAQNKPWPMFVRVGGAGPNGESGIKDGQFAEALEWDLELAPKLNAKDPRTFPKVITSAPPATKPGLLDRPTRIIS